MPGPSPSPSLELLIRHEGGEERLTPVGPVTLGRGEEADVRVSDPKVSRLHCRLEVVNGALRVTDLGSSNGTWVEDQEVSQVSLVPGECARAGRGVVIGLAPAGADQRGPAPDPAGSRRGPLGTGAVPPEREPEAAGSSKDAVPPAAPPRRVTTREAPRPPGPTATSAPRPVEADTPPPEDGRGRNATRSTDRTSTLVLLSLLAVLVLGTTGWLLFTGPSEEVLAVRKALGELESLVESSRFEAARLVLQRLPQDPGSLELEPGERRRLEELTAGVAAGLERLEALRGTLKGCLDRQPPLPAPRLLDAVQGLLRREGDLLPPEERRKWATEARAVATRRASRVVDAARVEVDAALAAGYFGRAEESLREALAHRDVYGSAQDRLEQLLQATRSQADRSFRKLVARLETMEPAERVRASQKHLPHYAGSSHAGALKARLRLARAEAEAARRDNGVVVGFGSGGGASFGDVLRKLEEGEELVSRRHYAEALPLLEQALEKTHGGPRHASVARRRDRVARLSAAMDALITRMKARPGRFVEVFSDSPGISHRLESVDREGLRLSFSVTGSGRSHVGSGSVAPTWERMPRDRFVALISRARLSGERHIDLAELLVELGAQEAALEELASCWRLEPEHRERIASLVAEAQGRDGVPAQGYVLWRGRLLTPDELDRAQREARIRELVGAVVTAEPGDWKAPASELRALGAGGGSALRGALERRLDALRERLLRSGPFRTENLAGARAAVFKELEDRREAALELIFDKERYPYPYGPGQEEVQAEVDRLRRRVEQAWHDPARLLVEKVPELAQLVADMEAVAAALEELGGEAEGPAAGLEALDRRLDIPGYAPDSRTRKLLAHYKAVRAHNEASQGVIRTGEREVLRITNAYRVMMGRRALQTDDRLVKAARGHSQEMADLGYFGHKSPTPGRTNPGDRARLAGWGGGVSENIARGNNNPARVVEQWLHSSGHHRNLLGARHTHLGVGASEDGGFWTQNFGRGAVSPDKPRAGATEGNGDR